MNKPTLRTRMLPNGHFELVPSDGPALQIKTKMFTLNERSLAPTEALRKIRADGNPTVIQWARTHYDVDRSDISWLLEAVAALEDRIKALEESE